MKINNNNNYTEILFHLGEEHVQTYEKNVSSSMNSFHFHMNKIFERSISFETILFQQALITFKLFLYVKNILLHTLGFDMFS